MVTWGGGQGDTGQGGTRKVMEENEAWGGELTTEHTRQIMTSYTWNYTMSLITSPR